jgi:hypothetical protein
MTRGIPARRRSSPAWISDWPRGIAAWYQAGCNWLRSNRQATPLKMNPAEMFRRDGNSSVSRRSRRETRRRGATPAPRVQSARDLGPLQPPLAAAPRADRFAHRSQSCLHHDSFCRVRSERRAAGMCGRSTDKQDRLCRLTAVQCSIRWTSRSRRCHNVWHVPRSNWMRRESTGAHFTLKLANSGSTSVGRARFKSPLAHQ